MRPCYRFAQTISHNRPIHGGPGDISNNIPPLHQLVIDALKDRLSLLGTLTVGLGGVVTTLDDKILRSVVVLASEVAFEDSLGTVGVSDLSIDGGTGHVRNHGVTTSPWVGGVAQRVVLGCGLGEPDVTTVSAEVAGLESLGNILLDDNGATGGVDEPRTLLHLGNELLVEEATGLVVQRAVDGDNITLCQHLLEAVDTAAANLLLNLGAEGLVVEVQKLLAVEGLETAQDTLSNTTNGDGTDDLVLKIVLVLGGTSDVPLTLHDLLVCGNKVTDEDEDGHDDVLGDGHDVGTGHLGDSNTAVGCVGSIEINMVGTDTSSDGNLQVLGLGKTLFCKVSGVEALLLLVSRLFREIYGFCDIRSGNDDLSIH